ncbi:S-layer homology domain-containing protein [Sedimentibacter sp.]|uniref:S-layer homology domain-containing protein n=1 Tax=Sedimentibacter sp. TaxID=1960295 RepID=UPI002898E6FC|nr:S-layer homology domain-containing protein [Sedimentibacter sp.]
MKKVLSLVLVIAMVLSSMSFAFAAKFEDVVDTDYEKAINTLVALKVVDGYEDGTYRPENVVTRAEMAKLMVQLLGYGDLVAGSKSNFADTQGHWADAWIALAAGNGLVIGTGDGKFTPDRTVSYDEVLTMLVRGLGYTDDCNELKGTWPSNFKVKAAELGITKSVKINATGADRGGVAQAMFNALEAKIVTVDNDRNVKDVIDGKGKTRQLLSRIAELDDNYTVSSELLDPSNKKYAGNFVDLAPYMFQNLEVYLNDDDEVVYIKDSNSLVVEGEIDEVTATGKVVTVAIELADGSIKKVDFDTTASDAAALAEKITSGIASVFYNGANATDLKYEDLEDSETIKIVANEDPDKSNGKIEKGEVDGIVLETQTSVIRVEEKYSVGDRTLDGLTLPEKSSKVDLTKIKVKGEVDSLEDIDVDDVVVEYLAEDDEFTTLVVTRDTIEGEVTRQGGTDVYVDGTKYKISRTSGAASDPEVGDSGIFYLDHNGKIVDYDTEAEGATDYAVVMGVEAGAVKHSFGKVSIDDYPQIKLTTQAGDEVVYDMYLKIDSNNKISNSAKLDKVAFFDKTYTVTNDVIDGDGKITSTTFTDLKDLVDGHPQVIKYKLNNDNKITKIELVDAKKIEGVDTTKSSFKLLSDALVYDYQAEESVNQDKLSSKITEGFAVYNKKGEIQVLLIKTIDVDDTVFTFAYITSVNKASNKGDNVQALKAYMNGEFVDPLFTDDDELVDKTETPNVFALDMDGEIVTDATAITTTSTALGGKTLTVHKGTIDDRGNDTIKIGSTWHTLSEDATVIGVDSDGDVNAVRKLSSIRAGKTEVDVYMYNGYVQFVVIHE